MREGRASETQATRERRASDVRVGRATRERRSQAQKPNLQGVPEGPIDPQRRSEGFGSPEGFRRPQKAPEAPKESQKAAEGPRDPQRAPEGPSSDGRATSEVRASDLRASARARRKRATDARAQKRPTSA
eukprot:5208916-Karenia_brevis.AAC.1